jgi:hypothetical protein
MCHRVTKTGERQRGDLVGRRRRSGNGSGDGSALTENGEPGRERRADERRAEAAEQIAWRGELGTGGLNGRWGGAGGYAPRLEPGRLRACFS